MFSRSGPISQRKNSEEREQGEYKMRRMDELGMVHREVRGWAYAPNSGIGESVGGTKERQGDKAE